MAALSPIYNGIKQLARAGAGTLTTSATTKRNGTTHLTGLEIAILYPNDNAARQQLADLGGERARKLGYSPVGTDVIDGDEITAASKTYIVEGSDRSTAICVVMALSEVNPNG